MLVRGLIDGVGARGCFAIWAIAVLIRLRRGGITHLAPSAAGVGGGLLLVLIRRRRRSGRVLGAKEGGSRQNADGKITNQMRAFHNLYRSRRNHSLHAFRHSSSLKFQDLS